MSTHHGGRHTRSDDDRSNTDHVEWDELAVGYALAALEPSELSRFIEHLVNFCPQCQASVDDTYAVGAGMADAMSVPPPSSELRTSVLQAAFAERPAVPQTSADLEGAGFTLPVGDRTGDDRTGDARSGEAQPVEARPADDLSAARAARAASATDESAAERPADQPSSAGNSAAGSPLIDLDARRRRRAPQAGWLLAAAAAVVAAVLGVTTVFALNSRNDERSRADAGQQTIQTIVSGSAKVVPLKTDAGQQLATVVARPDAVSVLTDGIPVNTTDTTYVLWGVAGAGKDPVALGVFDVRKTNLQTVLVGSDSTARYRDYATFAVSREPGRTAPVKPSQIVALGNA